MRKVSNEAKRIEQELRARDLYDETDRAIVNLYLAAYEQWLQATVEAKGQPLVVASKSSPVLNPIIRLKQKCEADMYKYLTELQLTPKQRIGKKGSYLDPIDPSEDMSHLIQ